MLGSVLFVLAAYLWGAIPTAYIAGRVVKGIDIRRYGSGNVGGSNLWRHVARWAFWAVGIFDFCKGIIPVLAARWLGLGLPVAAAAGLAAVVGHNWSVYLGFTGGRGIGTSLGVLIALAPAVFAVALAGIALGFALHATAIGTAAGLLLAPLVAWALGQPAPIIACCLALIGLMALKRLTANWEPLPGAPQERRRVLLNRLLLDRDIRDYETWVGRQPRGQVDKGRVNK
jgi:glycerol-3-phosphate acyltransferase PlsY